jgi:RNA polymerase sigma factor (sigma-70 family)
MIATRCERSDCDLVEAVRDGDDSAFEELYRRYHDRIAAYVRRKVRDPARAEDLAQDAFFSALRRIRATDSEIAFKPWIFEIARNATIDHWRRTSRAEEVSVEADELRPSDRGRLIGSAGPDSVLVDKERFDHLRGAFDELSDVHTRILVMRELEGLSYREIAEKLDLSRASVESALFRARRRLESEYADISEGRRCVAMRTVMARLAEGLRDKRDETRLARHARRCHVCRRRARELGVEPLAPLSGIRGKAAALLPLPLFTRRGGDAAQGGLSSLFPAGAHVTTAVAERAAAIAAAAALAGAGGMALSGDEAPAGGRDGAQKQRIEHRAPEKRAERSGPSGPLARPGAQGETGTRNRADTPRGDRMAPSVHGTSEAEQTAGPDGAGDEAHGTETTQGAGDVGLPDLSGIQGGGRSGGSGGGPDLPAPPVLPSYEPPAAPELPLASPGAEAPRSQVDAPVAPELPAAAPLDAVAGITAG